MGNHCSSSKQALSQYVKVKLSKSNETPRSEKRIIIENPISNDDVAIHPLKPSGSVQLGRSSSLRFPPRDSEAPNDDVLRRSSSSLTDPLHQPHLLLNQDVKLEDAETKHFVLVHGGGFGAWCWYKTIGLLVQSGFKVDAIDLTGSGSHFVDPNNITCLLQYVKPLTEFLETLPQGHQVILVGHDFGGTCISYAMELFPLKISKAVFIAATMLSCGQSTLDIFSQQENILMQKAQKFSYANGKDNPPTSFYLDKSCLGDLLFNQCLIKDVTLASVSMRPVPFTPISEIIYLSEEKYGSVRRFYIETVEDNVIPTTLQESMIHESPPEKVFRLKGADHSPFFSKPHALHKSLVQISNIP